MSSCEYSFEASLAEKPSAHSFTPQTNEYTVCTDFILMKEHDDQTTANKTEQTLPTNRHVDSFDHRLLSDATLRFVLKLRNAAHSQSGVYLETHESSAQVLKVMICKKKRHTHPAGEIHLAPTIYRKMYKLEKKQSKENVKFKKYRRRLIHHIQLLACKIRAGLYSLVQLHSSINTTRPKKSTVQ